MKRYNKNLANRSSNYRPFSERRYAKKAKTRLIFTLIATISLLYATLVWIIPGLIGQLAVINRLKDSPKGMAPISDNSTLAPPVLNIPYEATNTANISIKGYATPNTKVEVYVDEVLSQSADVLDDGSFTVSGITLTLGTNNLTGKTVNGNNKSLPSKNIRILYDNKKPKLDLTSPSDNQVIKGGDKKVTVSGATDPGNNVTVNSNKLIVDSSGNFSKLIEINDGDNNLTITTTDQAGNENSISRKVTYTSG